MSFPTSDELRLRAALAFISGFAGAASKDFDEDTARAEFEEIRTIAQRVLDGGEVYPMRKVS